MVVIGWHNVPPVTSNIDESAVIYDELPAPRADSLSVGKGENTSSCTREVLSQDDAKSTKATSFSKQEEQMMLTMYALLQDMNSRM